MGAYSPMEKNAKLRPFLVAKIIFERTDEDNYLTIAQILDILKKEYPKIYKARGYGNK